MSCPLCGSSNVTTVAGKPIADPGNPLSECEKTECLDCGRRFMEPHQVAQYRIRLASVLDCIDRERESLDWAVIQRSRFEGFMASERHGVSFARLDGGEYAEPDVASAWDAWLRANNPWTYCEDGAALPDGPLLLSVSSTVASWVTYEDRAAGDGRFGGFAFYGDDRYVYAYAKVPAPANRLNDVFQKE